MAGPRSLTAGFTLIELLVVMAIIGTLLSIVVPRYFGSVDRSKEAVLKENLRVMRVSIDQYHADHDRYPENLEALVGGRYMRAVPVDPITDTVGSWVVVPPPAGTAAGLVYDVRSGASGKAVDGSAYKEW